MPLEQQTHSPDSNFEYDERTKAARKMNHKLGSIDSKDEIEVVMDEYKGYCETLSKEDLQDQMIRILNSSHSQFGHIDKTPSKGRLEWARLRILVEKEKWSIIRDVFVRKHFQAARGGLANVTGLTTELYRSLHGGPNTEARHYQLSDGKFNRDTRRLRATLRIVEEVEEGADKKGIKELYELLIKLKSQGGEQSERRVNIVKEALASKEGYDVMTTDQLKKKLKSANTLQMEVIAYVVTVQRNSKLWW